MPHLAKTLYTHKNIDCLSSPDVKDALNNTHKDFVVVPIDKATGTQDLLIKKL